MNEPYEELANAVILQAVRDWRSSAGKLKRHPENSAARQVTDECERFFLSERFSVLTRADGKIILRRLKEEIV